METNSTVPIVFMKFSEGLSNTGITIFWAKFYDCVCWASTQPKEDEEEGREGFPGEVTHGLNTEGWVGAGRVHGVGLRKSPKTGIHQWKGVQARERGEYLRCSEEVKG